jgi:outer membrane protein
VPGLGRKCRLRASVSKVIRREHRGAFMRPSLSASLVILAVLRPMACLADDSNEWYGRVGALGAIYHSSATIATEAGAIPGATAHVSNSETATLEVGYDVTSNAYLVFLAGVPPKPTISGEGSVQALGKLGEIRYGPAILSAGYRLPAFGYIQPYVGAGAAYAIIFRNYDAAVTDLRVHNHFGSAVQAGADFRINDTLAVFVDVKQLWLSVNANGSLNGEIPVTARVKLNPTLISAGIKFRLR